MSKQIEEMKIVTALRKSMLERLRSNSHKNWRNLPVNELIEMMQNSVSSLKTKLFQMDLEQAKRNCADVANFTAMIFDNIDQKFMDKKKSDGMPSTNIQKMVDDFFKEIYDKAEHGGKQVICELLNTGLGTISRWRSGEVLPRIETLDQMWLMLVDNQNEIE